jgi:hypothetical protein
MACTKYLSKRNSGLRDRGTLPGNVKKAHPYRMETVEQMPLVFWALVSDVYGHIFAEGIVWAMAELVDRSLSPQNPKYAYKTLNTGRTMGRLPISSFSPYSDYICAGFHRRNKLEGAWFHLCKSVTPSGCTACHTKSMVLVDKILISP